MRTLMREVTIPGLRVRFRFHHRTILYRSCLEMGSWAWRSRVGAPCLRTTAVEDRLPTTEHGTQHDTAESCRCPLHLTSSASFEKVRERAASAAALSQLLRRRAASLTVGASPLGPRCPRARVEGPTRSWTRRLGHHLPTASDSGRSWPTFAPDWWRLRWWWRSTRLSRA